MNIYGKKIFLDTENTVTIYQKLSKIYQDISILESVIGGDNKGRYSIIFFNIYENIKVFINKATINKKKINIKSPDKFIRQIYAQQKLSIKYNEKIPLPILVGSLTFDLCKFTLPKLKYNIEKNEINIPLAHFVKPKNLIIIDNILNETHLIEVSKSKSVAEKSIYKIQKLLLGNFAKQKSNHKNLAGKFKSHTTKLEYINKVNQIKKEIVKGEIFQAVLSQRFSAPYKIHPFQFYRSLRSINPSPYLVFFNLDDYQIICSSPETMINIKNRKITLRPIAGTRKRGKNKSEDKKLAKELLNDPKELSEHLMLLDLGRNDVGRASQDGSVKVNEKFKIEKYSHVMHIVSNVYGKFKKNISILDGLLSGFPAGTVSGAPKIRAMEIIDELENRKRKLYAGGVGYFSSNGNMDTCIALRTALVKNNKIYVQAGAGIVADSVPEKEFQETVNKAKALLEAAK